MCRHVACIFVLSKANKKDVSLDRHTIPPRTILRHWVVPYLAGTLLAGFVGAPLVWFGLDFPIERAGVLRAMALGTAISYAIMLTIDIVTTSLYLYTAQSMYTERVRRFPLFAVMRSLSVHWLGFALPLVILWKSAFNDLQIPVTAIQIGFFLVVALLMSYIHAIIEFHLLGRVLDRFLGQPSRATKIMLPLAVKIGGIALFVGVVPVALLAETLYLKLTRTNIAGIGQTARLEHVIGWTFGYTIISIVVCVVLSWLLASDISRASKRLTEGFRMLARGDKKHRVAIATMDEFEELGAGFNTMAGELERNEEIYEEFGRLVDPAIRDEVLAGRVNREGELRHGVILFCDLVNFTPLSEAVSPVELIAYLNDLFDRLVNEISAHGGIVNKFVGDAILAFWNLPLTSPEPELAAVRCALAMQTAVAKFNIERAEWRNRHQPALPAAQVGVGIHAGKVVAGTVGAEQRREYTVLGANVNLASRIQNLTRINEFDVVVSDAVAMNIRSAQDTGHIELHSLGEVSLKGVSETQLVWGVTHRQPEPSVCYCM